MMMGINIIAANILPIIPTIVYCMFWPYTKYTNTPCEMIANNNINNPDRSFLFIR
jgi:hypothetical protein